MAKEPQGSNSLWSIARAIFREYRHLLDPFGIMNKASWLLYQFVFLSLSFFFAVSLYLTLYHLYIPIMHQSARLYLYKTDYGYLSRVFSSDGQFPICQGLKLNTDPSGLTEEQLLRRKICANPLDLGTCELTLGQESYEVSLKLVLPENAQNLNNVGSVPVYAEFISKENTFITTYTEEIPVKESLGISSMIKGIFKTIGLAQGDQVVDVVISQNFANSLFDLSVINIEIRQPHAIIKSGVIETVIILRGIRWFMYHWFWTCLVFTVGFITSTLLIFLNVMWRCCSATKNKIRPPNRKNNKRPKRPVVEAESEESSEEELAQDSIIENRKKQEAAQKKTMDSFLKKFN